MTKLNNSIIKHFAHATVKSDHEADELHLQSIANEESEVVVNNSKGMQRWDVRYNKFLSIANEYELPHRLIDRGIWTAVAVLDYDSTELCLFMSEKNIDKIKKNFLNYGSLASMINGSRSLPLDLEFDSSSEFIDNREHALQEFLTENRLEEITTVTIFGFESYGGFETFKEYRFDESMNEVYSKDWSYLIDSDFNSVSESDHVITGTNENNKALISKKNEEKKIVRLKEELL